MKVNLTCCIKLPLMILSVGVVVSGLLWYYSTVAITNAPWVVLILGISTSIVLSCSTYNRTMLHATTHKHIYHDYLTNLPNRRLLDDRFKQSLINAQRNNTKIAVLFLDLDHFKPINDTYGHDAGDIVLKTVAGRLSECLREGDTVSRMGGDEFVILLQNVECCTSVTDIGEACTSVTTVADKIIATISEPITIYGDTVSVGSSMGISIFPKHGNDYETLLKNADDAMYVAKDNGRNNYKFAKVKA